MKKIILSVIAIATFGFSQAQEVKYGAKAGLNLATLSGDIEDLNSKIGFHIGAFAEIKFTEKFSFQPELLMSTQGAKYEYSESEIFGGTEFGFSEESNLKLTYLNIPLMAKYYATSKFSLEVGPQIGFLVSAKEDYEYVETIDGDVDYSESEDGIDVKDNFKSIDFGMNFGLGYNFTDNVSAGIRYNLGLSNILEDSGDFEAQNSVFQLSLGYRF